MDYRTRRRLRALRNADEALYRLWKTSEFQSVEMFAINSLQRLHIHPAIKAIEENDRQRRAARKLPLATKAQ